MSDYDVLVDALRSYNKTSGYATRMHAAADAITALQARVAELERALDTLGRMPNANMERAECAEARLRLIEGGVRPPTDDDLVRELGRQVADLRAELAAAQHECDSQSRWRQQLSGLVEQQESELAAARAAMTAAVEALDEAQAYTSSPSWSPSMTRQCFVAASQLRAALAAPREGK